MYRPIQIPPGIERNNTAYDTPNRWFDMNQVRWVSGSIQPIGGWQRNTSSPLDSLTRKFNVWRANSTARAVLLATDAMLYVDDSGSYADITPDGYLGPGAVTPSGGFGTGPYSDDDYGTPRSTPSPIFSPYGFVSFGQWGEDAIVCSNQDGRLLYYDLTTPLAPPVPIGPAYSPVATAEITASIATTTMTVTAVASGVIAVGDLVTGTGVSAGTTVVSFGSGSGGTGTYTVSISQTASSATFESFNQTTTGAPVSNTAVIVTPERHVLAVGVGGNPKMIGWSSQEDQTDWDFASLTNTAGNLTLTSKTPLLYAVGVAEGTLVFSYTDVFLVRYVGLPSVYGGATPISDTSLLNPLSIATFGGKAAWPTRQGFQVYAGGSVQTLPCPVVHEIMYGDDPSIAMDATFGPFRIHGAYSGRHPELWWFYPSVGNSECNRYIAWNYAENFWFWGELPRSAMSPADAYQYPFAGGADGHVYTHEFGDLANGATRVGQIWIESGALTLANGDNVTNVGAMQIATGVGPQNLNVSFFGRYSPEGEEFEEGPFVPRTDGVTDVRLEYRDLRMRLTAAQDGKFSVGLIRMDVQPGGRR